jgi:hypothetical protein
MDGQLILGFLLLLTLLLVHRLSSRAHFAITSLPLCVKYQNKFKGDMGLFRLFNAIQHHKESLYTFIAIFFNYKLNFF